MRTVMAARAPVTLVLIVVNVVTFVAQQLIPGFTTHLYAFSPAIAHGQWYRLFTAMFLHAGTMHIVFNMLALFYLGPMAEDIIGKARFAVGYLVSGLFASAVSYLISPFLSPSLGASGAIFGVFALVMVLAYKRRSDPGANALLRNLIGLLVLNALLFFVFSNIDIWAHIGGFVGGAILGFAFDRPHSTRSWSIIDGTAPVFLLALTILIVVVRTAGLPG